LKNPQKRKDNDFYGDSKGVFFLFFHSLLFYSEFLFSVSVKTCQRWFSIQDEFAKNRKGQFNRRQELHVSYQRQQKKNASRMATNERETESFSSSTESGIIHETKQYSIISMYAYMRPLCTALEIDVHCTLCRKNYKGGNKETKTAKSRIDINRVQR